MTTAIIVQARLGSTRLPGKVLRDLAGETVLSQVLRRCQAVANAQMVVCATTTAAADQAVAEDAERCGAVVFRGSESDVLARYHGAARLVGADVVLRVTSDCPLIDPDICAQVIALQAATGADYVANNTPPSWPHGLDCEAFAFAALERAMTEATAANEREHVTPWLRTHPHIRRANLAGPGHASLRWTLDYPEDLAFFRAVFAHLPKPPAIAGMNDVLTVLAAHPEINAINAMRREPGRG